MVDYHQKSHRFQVTIKTRSGTVSHVCTEYTETEAIMRIKRSYGDIDPEVVRILHLGCLPKPRALRGDLGADLPTITPLSGEAYKRHVTKLKNAAT